MIVISNLKKSVMEDIVPRDNVTRPHSTPVKKKCHRPTAKIKVYIAFQSGPTAKKIKKCRLDWSLSRGTVSLKLSQKKSLIKKSPQTDRQTDKQKSSSYYIKRLAIHKCFASRLVPIQTQLAVTKSASRALYGE